MLKIGSGSVSVNISPSCLLLFAISRGKGSSSVCLKLTETDRNLFVIELRKFKPTQLYIDINRYEYGSVVRRSVCPRLNLFVAPVRLLSH